jgi:hypothetical protein
MSTEVDSCLCLCRRCSRLFRLCSSSFEQRPHPVDAPAYKRFHHSIVIHPNSSHWRWESQFKELLLPFTEFGLESLFPCCPQCTANTLRELKTRCDNYRRQIDELSALSHLPLSDIETQIQAEIKPFQPPPPKPNPLLRSIPHQPPIESPPPLYKTQWQLIDSPFPSIKITQLAAFHIGTRRHYITINDSRLGFYGFSPCSIDENNVTLLFLSHFVWSFVQSFSITIPGLSISPRGVMTEAQLGTFELQIPNELTASKLEKFNSALYILFKLCAKVFAADVVISHCTMPPFFINAEGKMIESIPYSLVAKAPDRFSLAMKYLLFDLKVMQTRCLDRFIQLLSDRDKR